MRGKSSSSSYLQGSKGRIVDANNYPTDSLKQEMIEAQNNTTYSEAKELLDTEKFEDNYGKDIKNRFLANHGITIDQ